MGPYQGALAAMARILETKVSALAGGRMERRQEGVYERFRDSAGHTVVNMERLSAWIQDCRVLHRCSLVVTLGRSAVLAACVRMGCRVGLLDALSDA